MSAVSSVSAASSQAQGDPKANVGQIAVDAQVFSDLDVWLVQVVGQTLVS